MAEIPDDVVNFFNNRPSLANHDDDEDEDVGLLHLGTETTAEARLTTDCRADSGKYLSTCVVVLLLLLWKSYTRYSS